MDESRRRGGLVIVEKLDRLKRDVAFISRLMVDGVRFIVAELGSEVDRSCCNLRQRRGWRGP